ncbi:MAG: NUDIX domain-containing protein [Planctomycetota bacterium]|jgi:8-oxo-dGTP diphosphatase
MAVKGKYMYEWPRPMVTVDAVVFLEDRGKTKLLLIKRGKEPFRGKWVFPGGFLEMDEELADGAARELAEEAGLVGVELEQMHTFGNCGRDPRGRVIGVAFVGTVGPDNATVKAGDDAAEAGWFDIDQLPELAFDHNEMAKMAIEKMYGA